MKTIVSGIGFLVAGLMVAEMLERYGIHLDTWVLVLIFSIGVALIIWGAIPSKVKDAAGKWAKDNVQLIFPNRTVTVRQLEKELRWYKIRNIFKRIIGKFRQ